MDVIYTFFNSWKVLILRPWVHESNVDLAMASMFGSIGLMASSERAAWTSFLIWLWYVPCWKKIAIEPINLSLLFGYVGLNKLAFVLSTNFTASGLATMMHGHPSMCVLNISPYLSIQPNTIYSILIQLFLSIFFIYTIS